MSCIRRCRIATSRAAADIQARDCSALDNVIERLGPQKVGLGGSLELQLDFARFTQRQGPMLVQANVGDSPMQPQAHRLEDGEGSRPDSLVPVPIIASGPSLHMVKCDIRLAIVATTGRHIKRLAEQMGSIEPLQNSAITGVTAAAITTVATDAVVIVAKLGLWQWQMRSIARIAIEETVNSGSQRLRQY